jgi:LmbE family N-acetylglucosaminyl deacetylase
MNDRKVWWAALAGALFLFGGPLWGTEISVEGGPMDTGFNSGGFAYIHATVHGLAGQPKRYVVFAEIQYLGTTSNTNLEMDRLPETQPGVEEFQVGWPIPAQAPTGFYTLTLHVDDRIDHTPEVTKKVRGFVVYKKLVRITRVTLDKTQYNAGEPIKCEVGLENLSDNPVKDLRLEFSNAIYPWISLYSQGWHDNPELAVRTLREHLDIPAGTALTVPMMAAGTATLLPGRPGDGAGSGVAPGNPKIPPPEVDTYAVALWNADHTTLYDMQFTLPATVRSVGRDLPKPYGRNFTHPYNASIDFTRYREFYAPGQISAAISVDHAVTLFSPEETVPRQVTVKNTSGETWRGAHVEVKVTDAQGRERGGSPNLVPAQDYSPGQSQRALAVTWAVSKQEEPGIFFLKFSVVDSDGRTRATTSQEIAVNQLPASLLVIGAQEGDEQPFAGLIRAAVEGKIPVQVLILTAGDWRGCDRYFDMSCGPNEAREFGRVHMEESAEALEHLGVPRAKLTVLGLPEDGLGAIWFGHKELFLSINLACDHAPYENVYQPNLPYARDAVIAAIRQIITDFHPAMIALTHPDDRQPDRRTASWFAIKACQELLKAKGLDPQTVVLADQMKGAGDIKPAPYKYENFVVHLGGEAAALKQEMAWLYQSRDGNQAESQRKTLAELPREENHLRIMDWQEHEGWNEAARN